MHGCGGVGDTRVMHGVTMHEGGQQAGFVGGMCGEEVEADDGSNVVGEADEGMNGHEGQVGFGSSFWVLEFFCGLGLGLGDTRWETRR